MTRWAVFLYLLTGLCSCAHKFRTVDNREASAKEEWASVEKKHVEQRQQNEQKKTERTATYTRKTIPSPQGPIVEESWAASLSEIMASSGVVSVSSGSVTSAGNRHEKAASKVETMKDVKPAGFSIPWWCYVGALGVLLFFAGRLLWRAGWRPWKR